MTTIQKWGNSFAVRLPKAAVDALKLVEGQSVRIETEHGRIAITPAKRSERSLEALIAGITSNNIHEAVLWGGPVGKEAW